MTDYDNDPRYEFVEEGVYLDTQTNETVFVLDGELAESLFEMFGTDEITSEQSRELLEPFMNKLLYDEDNIFHNDSDLNDL